MAKSYIQEHLVPSILNEDEFEFKVELCTTQDDLIRVRFQSRHIHKKIHIATVQFDAGKENPICGYYCTCISGSRELGCCVHIAALLWHMGVQRAKIDPAMHPLSAIKLLQTVHDSIQYSISDTDSDDEEDIRYTINQNSLDTEDHTTDDEENNNSDLDE